MSKVQVPWGSLSDPLPADDVGGLAAEVELRLAAIEMNFREFETASGNAPPPPAGAAGGDLTGTYPNPQIAAGVITDADVNALNKDGLAATPSMRTLGTGATQALPGNTPVGGSVSFVTLAKWGTD